MAELIPNQMLVRVIQYESIIRFLPVPDFKDSHPPMIAGVSTFIAANRLPKVRWNLCMYGVKPGAFCLCRFRRAATVAA